MAKTHLRDMRDRETINRIFNSKSEKAVYTHLGLCIVYYNMNIRGVSMYG